MIKTKQLAAMLALLLAFVMLFSVLYVALEADHDCCGEDCAVCAQLQFFEDLLRNLLSGMVASGFAAFFCALTSVAAKPDCGFAAPHTLISLKVKLSN